MPDPEHIDVADVQQAARAGAPTMKHATREEYKTAMPTFMLTHHFPNNFQSSPETAAAATAWFERLAANLTGRGNPAAETRRLGNCSNGAERTVAYTLITTDDLEAAVALAQAWPLLARGGGVEVRELTMTKPSVSASA